MKSNIFDLFVVVVVVVLNLQASIGHQIRNFTVNPTKIEIDVFGDSGKIKRPEIPKESLLTKAPMRCVRGDPEISSYCYLLCRKNNLSKGECDEQGHCICSEGGRPQLRLFLRKIIFDANIEKQDLQDATGRPKHPLRWEIEAFWESDKCVCDNYNNCICSYSNNS